MTGLEASYRRLLRLYPPSYRKRREDEMLGVLVANAAPGQSRPAVRDRVDLLLGALRAWLRWVFLPDPIAARNAVAFAAIMLPALHLAAAAGLAARFIRDPIDGRWTAAARSLGRFYWSWPAWLLLVAAAIAVLAGSARVARAASLSAAGLVVVLGLRQFPYFNHDVVLHEMSWGVTAGVQAALLSRERLARGRAKVHRWPLALAFVVAAALGVVRTTWSFRGDPFVGAPNLFGHRAMFGAVAIIVLAALATHNGRVLAPPVGAGVALLFQTRVLGTPMAAEDGGRLLLLPAIVFVVLRILAAVAHAVATSAPLAARGRTALARLGT